MGRDTEVVRVGVLARANQRGLHVQTMEVARHLDADVLVVDVPNRSSRRYPTRSEAFPGAPVVHVGAGWRLPEREVRRWLRGVDVVYSAETAYDASLFRWAHELGVSVLVALNPEFVPPPGERDRQRGWGIFAEDEASMLPAQWWTHTCWRHSHLPVPTEVVPLPVAADRFTPVGPHDGPCRWLVLNGKTALADRNGTEAVLQALPLLREQCTVTVASQDPLPHIPNLPPWVQLRTVGAQDNYWTVYEGHDALVMPRRYGGLCLGVQEAMAAGMAVLMTACDPNPQTWPVATVPTHGAVAVRMPAGMVPVHHVDPVVLSAAMDALADPAERHQWQARSRAWAAANSWSALRGEYLARFEALRSTSPAAH